MEESPTSDPLSSLLPLLPRLQQGSLSAEELSTRLRAILPDLVRRLFHQKFSKLDGVLQTDDVVQKAMLPLLRSLFKTPPDDADQFRGRIWKVIWRTLMDLVRKHDGPHGDGANLIIGGIHSENAQVTGHTTQRQNRMDIQDILSSLPVEDAELVFARFYLELSNEEIAGYLQVDRGTVTRRLNRILAELGKRLGT